LKEGSTKALPEKISHVGSAYQLRYNKYPVGTDRELKIGKISENQLKFRSKFSNLLRVLAKIWKT